MISHRTALAVGGARERHLNWVARNDVLDFNGVSDGKDIRVVGLQVFVDADAEVRMEAANSSCKMCPITLLPNSAAPIAEKTSAALVALPSPTPFVPTPANATAAVATSA